VIEPSGASQVTSSMLLALTTRPFSGSAMTQSILHQPGSRQLYSHATPHGSLEARKTCILPAFTSSGSQEMGEPAVMRSPSLTTSVFQVPNLTWIN